MVGRRQRSVKLTLIANTHEYVLMVVQLVYTGTRRYYVRNKRMQSGKITKRTMNKIKTKGKISGVGDSINLICLNVESSTILLGVLLRIRPRLPPVLIAASRTVLPSRNRSRSKVCSEFLQPTNLIFESSDIFLQEAHVFDSAE